jgi:S1-C subfamily serine protease
VARRAGYDDFFNRCFFPRYYREQVRSIGSGVLVSTDGYILTNEHVTEDADSIWVTLPDGRTLTARLVGSDRETDLAVVDVEGEGLPAARLGNSDSLLIGEWALALGNPFGYLLDDPKPSVTVGVISAVDRDLKQSPDDERVYRKVIQTDAAINPGNSGGPLLDSRGRLIGLTTAIASPSGASAGVGFAIPVDTIQRIVPQLLRYGKVVRPVLGAEYFPDAYTRRLRLAGALIGTISPGGPAAAAGLQPTRRAVTGEIMLGDLIVAVDGQPVADVEAFFTALEQHQPGDMVKVTVVRNPRSDAEQSLDVSVTLGAPEEK